MSNPIPVSDYLDEDLDASKGPGLDQRRASAPDRHVWVRASAGSGKTKVLIDRLLRLLLPDPLTGAPGVAPDKILCLTFTKAGAAEMSLRLQKRLLEWSAIDDDALREKLKDLIGAEASQQLEQEARRLLARVLDAPSRLRILTIHSFCQSVLGRFPVETGLSPDFKVIEESEKSDYLQKVLNDTLLSAAENPQSELALVFDRLSIVKNLDQLQGDLQQIIQEPIKLQDLFRDHSSLADIRNILSSEFGIENLDSVTEEGLCREVNIPRASISIMADILSRSSPGDIDRSNIILNWLSANDAERLATFDSYKEAIIPKARGKAKDNPDFIERQQKEIERLDRAKLAGNIHSTADLLYLALRILKAYDRHKKFLGVLDYGDLIFYTRRLLSGDFWQDDEAKKLSTAWVLYKLDEGIDHILVDESQDTNPDQWDIVRRLSEEYFAGTARPTDRARSLFVVGDEKQSIFSFQRADPEVFHQMREYFAAKAATLQEGFEESLIFSFRSTAPVLKLTDAVFSNPELLRHIGIKDGTSLRHISHRSDNKRPRELHGMVELWKPVIDATLPAQEQGWQLPLGNLDTEDSAQLRLAKLIASRIQAMIHKSEALPGDIMILMRSRSPLMLQIIRELKNIFLPVSGMDRMVLSESLIVQDLLALCEFCLLAEDSFSLACALKSPFIGLSEEKLMSISLSRPKTESLWNALRKDSQYKDIVEWLAQLSAYAATVQPYEFLDRVLTNPCPADPKGSGYRACMARLGHDAIEPLDEILGEALKVELQDIRTLQDFVGYQRATRREVKREMEESAGQIRIMTVHASKGLEAPVVILPDTMSAPRSDKLDRFLWPDKSGLPAPLWSESKEDRSALYQMALDRLAGLQMEEYSRLLYVAMTRAKERLIVCGAAKSEDIKPATWYGMVSNGFDRLPDAVTTEAGDRVYSLTGEWPIKNKPALPEPSQLPVWILAAAPLEADIADSFTPSSQDGDEAIEEAVYSPIDQSREFRFKRGNATHKLLQILPDLPLERRENAARRYVAGAPLGLPRDIQDSIVDETMKILNDPVFAPVFGPGSLAEVPVNGKMADGRIINGQIDRLVITNSEILIIDFKTNRPSPGDVKAIPPAYRAQLKAYADALTLIYPKLPVKCALLWTDKPLLMPVSF